MYVLLGYLMVLLDCIIYISQECQNNYDDEFASRFQQFLDKDLNISANNEDATSNFLKCIEIHLQAKNCPSPCSRLWSVDHLLLIKCVGIKVLLQEVLHR